MRYRNRLLVSVLALSGLLLQACGSLPLPRLLSEPGVVRNSEFAVITAGPGDSLASLAYRFYGDARKSWQIADFNGMGEISPGKEVVIPLKHPNPAGIYTHGYQTIPILCYHRFGPKKDKMVVSAEDFSEQMHYLRDNGYRVIPLSDLIDFFKGEKPLPKQAVVITIDDGYKSSYEVAYPILKRFNFPATIFVYSDFVGAGDAMSWKDMREMIDTGLIDIQTHSKAHSNLAIKKANETDADYRRRIEDEVVTPTRMFRDKLKQRIHTFAFPYGDGNPLAVDLIKNSNYALAATVQKGGNHAFSYPYLLRRNMVLGDQDLDDFKKNLDTFTRISLQ